MKRKVIIGYAAQDKALSMDYKRKWVRDTQNDAREKQGLPNNATRDYKRRNARFCKAKEINTRHGVIMARCEVTWKGYARKCMAKLKKIEKRWPHDATRGREYNCQAILISSASFVERSLYQKERLYLILIAKQPKRSENIPTREL
ncbi:hypothetical protein CHS0354_042517 [Potamilus streckersoni]|uniref:Uncharacterized protein n=1 Tax=Potamilus streckersoni TaxID=2493646 RepID=A0AAE0TDR6_9BIVA|nr:hypothetical protein CHS0354_042517 [Potamilus streckersoni]